MHREFFEPGVFPIRFVSIVSLVSVVALCYPLAAKGEVFRGYLSLPNCSLECALASRMEEGQRLYLNLSLSVPLSPRRPASILPYCKRDEHDEDADAPGERLQNGRGIRMVEQQSARRVDD